MSSPRPQRRGRAIAMSPAELDEFLAGERTCRMATVGSAGEPHVTPLWFVWDGSSLWLNSLVRSQRWADVAARPEVAVAVDAGTAFDELRGVELTGPVAVVGEVPRGTAAVPALDEVERLYALKYGFPTGFAPDGRHAWLRLTPAKVVSWDFRKMSATD